MQELIEKLSALEHRQWRSWTEYLIENEDIPEDLEEKWKKNHIPYTSKAMKWEGREES